MTKLTEGCKKLGITISQEQLASLELYINEILTFNESYNLMKADNADELAVNHILDSLAPYSTIAELIATRAAVGASVTVGDIGSGGGCPGIPLAVVFPQTSFVLVERMEKRCEFLTATVKKMNLQNVTILCAQADKVAPESFDIEVFRAFHPFDKDIAKLLFRMLKQNGYIAAYKARSEKIAEEMENVKYIIPEYKKIALTVPFLEDHERNLLVIQKK
jgi:16S rRNA (guanine527-N7)-methyltransferase